MQFTITASILKQAGLILLTRLQKETVLNKCDNNNRNSHFGYHHVYISRLLHVLVGDFTVLWQEKGGLRRNRGVGVDVLDGTPVLDLKVQKEMED